MLVKLAIKTLCIGALTVGGMSWLASSQGRDPLAYVSALPWQVPDSLSLPPVPDLIQLPGAADAGQRTVYRWTDASGTPQFSTSRPNTGVSYQTVLIDPNANVLPAVTGTGSTRSRPSATAPTRDTASLPRLPAFANINNQLDQVQSAHSNRTRQLDADLRTQLP